MYRACDENIKRTISSGTLHACLVQKSSVMTFYHAYFFNSADKFRNSKFRTLKFGIFKFWIKIPKFARARWRLQFPSSQNCLHFRPSNRHVFLDVGRSPLELIGQIYRRAHHAWAIGIIIASVGCWLNCSARSNKLAMGHSIGFPLPIVPWTTAICASSGCIMRY